MENVGSVEPFHGFYKVTVGLDMIPHDSRVRSGCVLFCPGCILALQAACVNARVTVSFSTAPTTRASSCGAATLRILSSARPRRALPLTAPSALQERYGY